jgi:Holliday junction resolvase RusA-like endonuclease
MKLVIDGVPISQIRMKYSGRNGIGRIYDPREREKRNIKKIISSQYSNHPLFIHPRVSFIFHFPIPVSVPKRVLLHYKSGLLKHEKKPDTDNLLKLYLDCMDGICFDGDQKVSLGDCIKLYHPHPKTIIIINETQELLSPLEVDPMTWYSLFGKECGKCSFSEMVSLPDFYTPTQLNASQSFDGSYPQQIVDTCDSIPLVPHILEQARLASLQSHHQP